MPKSAKALSGMSKQEKLEARQKAKLAKIAAKKEKRLARIAARQAKIDAKAKRAAERAAKKAAKAQKASKPAQPRVSRKDRDWTIKPVIKSDTNKAAQQLLDRIEEAGGKALIVERVKALKELRDSFAPCNTYYKMARRYLDALLAKNEAKAAEAAGK